MADDGAPPARVVPLKRRPEFLRVAAHGRRWVTPAFVLQAGRRPAEGGVEVAAPEIGIGFTASRRVGKAVARNRARRRLREAVRRVLPGPARPGFDYVVVARPAALTRPFGELVDDLRAALARAPTARRRGTDRDRRKKVRDGLDSAPAAPQM
jgi:ribonuclease P protein component